MERAARDKSTWAERRTETLYVQRSTFKCAVEDWCVPCVYKIIQHPGSYTNLMPNQRPEMCPRCRESAPRYTGLYDPDARILTVGDGDMSFSVALARGGINLVATSHESEETVRSVFKNGSTNIDELKSLGVTVRFGVDATDLAACFEGEKFDRIVWNFPCVARGIAGGKDGQNTEDRALQC